jgi:hypothetical protein
MAAARVKEKYFNRIIKYIDYGFVKNSNIEYNGIRLKVIYKELSISD